ncbi:Uncharacterised protein [Vibrio cholerae]|nr:Uncharacterised protein [Vibrio cholerae]CSI80077.1 Uncharacterised protein [Vibrio cholerae]
MEHFCAHTYCFFQSFCANRLDHELLDVYVVVSVLTTVDDVHHW